MSTAMTFILESMEDAIFNRDDPHLGLYNTSNPNKICREKVHSELYNREKKIKGCGDKRPPIYNRK
jgi:hypothetical protein